MASKVTLPLAVLFTVGQVASEWTVSGQYQYLINSDKVYWSNGQNFCIDRKATAFLARPTHENAAFLKSFGSAELYWADHTYDGRRWVWSDGSPVPAGDVTWHSGYPIKQSIATKGLYERASATLMNTEPNYLVFPVVCQAPLDPTTVQPTTTHIETTTPEQTTTTPQPTTTAPGPTATTPEPPQPTTTTPQPTGTTPEPSTAPPAVCPSDAGWVLAEEDGRCYYLSSRDPAASELSWTDANQACDDQQATLASVPDTSTFYALSFQVAATGRDAWTGLLAVGPSWVDGTAFNPDLLPFLAQDEDGKFGYLSAADSKFHLEDGTATRAFLCYRDTAVPTTTSSPASTVGPCPTGWEQDDQTCYLFSQQAADWTTAAHLCHQEDADLVSISQQDQITFLLLSAGDQVYWTGMQNHDDDYVWEDGSLVDTELLKPYLDQWQLGKDCVAMDKSLYPQFLIHDNCIAEHPFVCRKHAD